MTPKMLYCNLKHLRMEPILIKYLAILNFSFAQVTQTRAMCFRGQESLDTLCMKQKAFTHVFCLAHMFVMQAYIFCCSLSHVYQKSSPYSFFHLHYCLKGFKFFIYPRLELNRIEFRTKVNFNSVHWSMIHISNDYLINC